MNKSNNNEEIKEFKKGMELSREQFNEAKTKEEKILYKMQEISYCSQYLKGLDSLGYSELNETIYKFININNRINVIINDIVNAIFNIQGNFGFDDFDKKLLSEIKIKIIQNGMEIKDKELLMPFIKHACFWFFMIVFYSGQKKHNSNKAFKIIFKYRNNEIEKFADMLFFYFYFYNELTVEIKNTIIEQMNAQFFWKMLDILIENADLNKKLEIEIKKEKKDYFIKALKYSKPGPASPLTKEICMKIYKEFQECKSRGEKKYKTKVLEKISLEHRPGKDWLKRLFNRYHIKNLFPIQKKLVDYNKNEWLEFWEKFKNYNS